MGREVEALARSAPDIEIVAEVDSADKNLPRLEALSELADVVIDFSTPMASLLVGGWCVQRKVAWVCGTTGWSSEDWEKIENAGRQIPVLWSSNMSLGVAILRKAMRTLSAVKHFDFQIEEAHHGDKRDRPSGTAITLQSELEKIVDRRLPPPLSIRGGDIKGEHRVWAMGPGEMLRFEHIAQDRSVFAAGAIQAARWLCGRPPGLYSLDQVLGFE